MFYLSRTARLGIAIGTCAVIAALAVWAVSA